LPSPPCEARNSKGNPIFVPPCNKDDAGQALRHGPCQSRLAELSMPMLVLSGKQDLSSTSDVMLEIARASKNSEHQFTWKSNLCGRPERLDKMLTPGEAND
jgi:hypothetical protein